MIATDTARKLGARAAQQDRPMTDCPYDQNTPGGRAAARAWVSGYLRWKPDTAAAVTFDDDDQEVSER
jgi:hypothetical protein